MCGVSVDIVVVVFIGSDSVWHHV